MDDLQKQNSALKFNTVSEAIFAGSYVEQILSSEHSWIASRLSWLFISQSFCISAYIVLLTSSSACNESIHQIKALRIAIPFVGILCSIFVGISIRAAATVAGHVADERSRISQYININAGTTIPLIGGNPAFRQDNLRSTAWKGALPQWLPLPLTILWLYLLISAVI